MQTEDEANQIKVQNMSPHSFMENCAVCTYRAPEGETFTLATETNGEMRRVHNRLTM